MGQVNATTITAASIVNTDIAQGAGISASKIEHSQCFYVDFGYLDADGSIATGDVTFYIPANAATIRRVTAFLVDTGTSTDIDFDLLVDGVTALTSQINITNATSDNTQVVGSIASASLTAGQVVKASIATVTSNTGALGPRMLIHCDTSYV